MQVLTEPLDPGNLANWNQAAQDFADDLTANYDEYADETPEFYEVKQLAKIVAVAKWILDNGIATDMSWAKDYEPEFTATPRQMPKLTTPWHDGGNGYQYNMSGGIQYDTSNTYDSDDGTAADLKSASEAVDAPKEQIHWTFTESAINYDAVAVEASAFRSVGAYSTSITDMSFPAVGDVNLNFSRSYSSFSGGQRGIGRGWSFMPSAMTDNYPVIGGIAITTCGGTTFKHRYKLSFDPANGGERESFTYNCDIGGGSYIPDQPQYHSEVLPSATTSTQVLYQVKMKDQMSYLFEDRFEDPTDTTRVNLKLIQMIDKNGNRLFYNYESTQSAKLVNISDEYNHRITLNYNATQSADLISSITDWNSRTVSYDYDEQGNLTSVTDPRGNVTTYEYDENNKLISVEDREDNQVITNTYTDEAKINTQTDASGLTTTYAYDKENQIVIATDSSNLNRDTSIKYDDRARILENIDALNNKLVYTYATESAPLTIRDKNNNLTTNTYDTRGNLTSVTYPDSKTVTYQYDSKNMVTSISDTRYGGSPKVTTFGYDGFGNLRFATESGKTTSFTYNIDGEMLTKTNPLGNTLTWTRDTFGNPLTEVNPLSKTTSFEYDVLGRLKRQTDPNSKSSFYTYDNNSNILTSSNSAGTTTFQYDKENRLKKRILPNTSETDYAYNDAGSVTSVTDELNNVTEYNYDNRKNLIERQDALDRTTLYEFDLINQATKSATPLGKVIKWEYDDNGNVVKRVDGNNQETNYDYDNMNKLIKITYPDSSEVEFDYDDRGNMIASISNAGTTVYEYDIYDRLIEVEDINDEIVSYEYDNEDNLTKVTYPGNKEVDYTYDYAGRLISINDWNDKLSTFEYFDNNLLKTKSLPNGVETSYIYDNANKVIEVLHERNENTIAKFEYVRDSMGNIISATESGELFGGQEELQGVELLDVPWELEGENESDELYQSLDSYPLQGKEALSITYDLNGLTALGGDASAIIFDQDGWQYISLSDYGQNGLDGVQTIYVSLDDFMDLDPEEDLTGYLHTRFYHTGQFNVDILSIKALDSMPSQPEETETELLDAPWELEGENESDELYQSLDSYPLQGKEGLSITYDLNGLTALGNDASAIIFDQDGWQYISLSDYGQNGLDGVQTIYVDLDDFMDLDPEEDLTGYLHSRFYHTGQFNVDILSIKALNSMPANLALNKPISSSSDEDSSLESDNANDGNPNSRWASAETDSEWLEIDLEGIYDITDVKIDWEEAYGSEYEIQVSNDSENWTTLFYTDSGNGGVNNISVEGTGRYIRMNGLDRGTPWGYSIWEFEVYGNEPEPPPTGIQNNSFDYDELGRLISMSNTIFGDLEYTYDDVGNMLSKELNSQLLEYNYNHDNQLVGFGLTGLTYDNNGNRNSIGSTNLSFDYDNRLSSFTASGSSTISYIYDGTGERSTKKEGAFVTREYVNDVSSNLTNILVEKDTISSSSSYFIYGQGVISQGEDNEYSRQYYLEDGLGNIRATTSYDGEIVGKYNYDPYGNPVESTGSAKLRYKGEHVDPNTNLYYLRARYYDPSTGSFISKDPVEGYLTIPQSQNGYSFVHGDPVNLSDPSGKDIYNKSNDYIIAVTSEGDFKIVEPKGTYRGDQDGVIFQDGTIYKNNDGVNVNAYGSSLAAPSGLLSGVINTVYDVGKVYNNTYKGTSLETSGYYALNDGSQTGKWNPGSAVSYIQSKNTNSCFNY